MSMRNEIYKNDGNDMCYYEICQLYKTVAAAVGTIMRERRTLREEEKKKEKIFLKTFIGLLLPKAGNKLN